jgi:hypothetical protein
MIQGNERLVFKTKTKDGESPVAEFAGLIDAAGHYEWKVGQPLPAGNSARSNQ